jgi:hypothetical protein
VKGLRQKNRENKNQKKRCSAPHRREQSTEENHIKHLWESLLSLFVAHLHHLFCCACCGDDSLKTRVVDLDKPNTNTPDLS